MEAEAGLRIITNTVVKVEDTGWAIIPRPTLSPRLGQFGIFPNYL